MRIVEKDGAVVHLANNGKEALDWICGHEGEVDIILMDVQMPVMDGYEATRKLRALPQFANLPVVALTAGAFKIQQDDALCAGMNAFVSKPFNVEELLSTIQRLTQNQPQLVEVVADRTGPVAVKPLQKLAGIAVEKGLDVWRDEWQYRKFLVKFSDDFADSCDLLETWYLDGDYVNARALLHKLKGAASNLALVDITSVAADIEAAQAAGATTLGLDRLRSVMEIARSSIKIYAAQAAPSEPLETSDQPLHQLLLELLNALDSDAPDNANRLVESMQVRLDRDFVAQIQKYIDNFDFRGAEALVRSLADDLQRELKN